MAGSNLGQGTVVATSGLFSIGYKPKIWITIPQTMIVAPAIAWL